jgi:hypothetical protein
MHLSGRLADARSTFELAEKIQQRGNDQFPLLVSLGSYYYCDLLLDLQEFEAVERRATRTLRFVKGEGDQLRPDAVRELLSVGLEHLSLGRAILLQAQTRRDSRLSVATKHLDDALTWVRMAGRQDYLPACLLARGELRLFTGDLPGAEADISSAHVYSTRAQQRLSEVDCHLARARLKLDMGDNLAARTHVVRAQSMIAQTPGYHRRDRQAEELSARSA